MIETKPGFAWKERTYPVPNSGPRRFRWKASAGCGLHRWSPGKHIPPPSTVIVPALYNRLPAETVAMGWLNEIDALHTIRQRMIAAARKTGWDVFTFHTQHNLDHYFDTAISALRDTWSHEGSLSKSAILETQRRFGNICDYYRIQPRLVENLVFQTSLIEWASHRAEDVPLEFHVVGTAVLSALVASGAVVFDTALDSALKVGARWDAAVEHLAQEQAEKSTPASPSEVNWYRFEIVERIMEGRQPLSLAVAKEDLFKAKAPARPFWFAPTAADDPIRIETARDVAMALDSLNLNSWLPGRIRLASNSFRGWLISPLHAMARKCRWSVSNYLLSTPSAVTMFIHNVAALSRAPIMAIEPDVQNRLRLSRMKVTGP